MRTSHTYINVHTHTHTHTHTHCSAPGRNGHGGFTLVVTEVQLHEDLVRIELDVQNVCARWHVSDVDPRTV